MLVALLALGGCTAVTGPEDVRMPRGEAEWRRGCDARGGKIIERGRELLCMRLREGDEE